MCTNTAIMTTGMIVAHRSDERIMWILECKFTVTERANFRYLECITTFEMNMAKQVKWIEVSE